MNLEQYWRFFANQPLRSPRLKAYNNGWFSFRDGRVNILFNDKAERIFCGSIRLFTPLPDGCFAISRKECGTSKWIIYRQNGDRVADYDTETMHPLANGFAVREMEDGTSILFNLFNENERFDLGYNVIDVIGMGELFIYGQTVRRDTLYHICRIKDGKLVKRTLNNVARPFFFASGSYALWEHPKNWGSSEGMFRVFNRFGQQIFASGLDNTLFKADISDNHFLVYNGMRYKGVYSAETGKLVFNTSNVDIYFDNGSYYVSRQGLTFGNGSGKISPDIYSLKKLGKSGAIFLYEEKAFVIDTDLSIPELRTKVQDELNHISDTDANYARYLSKLLTLLH